MTEERFDIDVSYRDPMDQPEGELYDDRPSPCEDKLNAAKYRFYDHTATRKADFFLPSAEGQLGYPPDMLRGG